MSNESDHFERIRLNDQIDRDRAIVQQYETGLTYYQGRIEDTRYELGRLDERLGGENQP